MKSIFFFMAVLLCLGVTQGQAQVSHQMQNAGTLKVFLLGDVSGSMSTNAKIDQLQKALNVFFKGVQQDGLLSQRIDLTLITFDSQARVVHKGKVTQSQAPKIKATGSTNMSAALQIVEQQLQNHASGLQPVVIVITDGNPSNRSTATQVAQALRFRSHFVALGVKGADMNYLQTVAGKNAAMLRGTRFSSFLKDTHTALGGYIRKADDHARMGVTSLGVSSFSIPNNSGWKE